MSNQIDLIAIDREFSFPLNVPYKWDADREKDNQQMAVYLRVRAATACTIRLSFNSGETVLPGSDMSDLTEIK